MGVEMPDLKSATDRLTGEVAELNERLEVSRLQAGRTRALIRACIAVGVACVLGLIATALLFVQVQKSLDSNHHTQVVNCQNQNDAREANLTLWTFLISQTKTKSDEEKIALQKLATYVTRLFAAHDCSDLSKKYPLPEPPRLHLS